MVPANSAAHSAARVRGLISSLTLPPRNVSPDRSAGRGRPERRSGTGPAQHAPFDIVERCDAGHAPAGQCPIGADSARSGVQSGADGPAEGLRVTPLPVLSRTRRQDDRRCRLLVLVVAAAMPGSLPPWQAWLALPVVVLAGRKQLELPTASSQSLVVGLDSALLVLLGLTLPPQPGAARLGRLARGRRGEHGRAAWTPGCSTPASACCPAPSPSRSSSVVPGRGARRALGLGGDRAAAAAPTSSSTSSGAPCRWRSPSGSRCARRSRRPVCCSPSRASSGVDSLGFLAAVVLEARPWALVLLAVPFLSLLLSTLRLVVPAARASRAARCCRRRRSRCSRRRPPRRSSDCCCATRPTWSRVPAASWAGEGDGPACRSSSTASAGTCCSTAASPASELSERRPRGAARAARRRGAGARAAPAARGAATLGAGGPADRPRQPHGAARGARPPPCRRSRGWRSCTATWTASSASTTPAGTPSATSCWSPSPTGCAPRCARATCRCAWAATSSPCCCATCRRTHVLQEAVAVAERLRARWPCRTS